MVAPSVIGPGNGELSILFANVGLAEGLAVIPAGGLL